MRVFYRRHDREALVRALTAGVRRLAESLPVREAVLFGSCAADRHTAASDVDLLVVYAGPPRPDAFRLVKDAVAITRLEPHVYSEAEAAGLGPVLARMKRNGIRIDMPSGCRPPVDPE